MVNHIFLPTLKIDQIKLIPAHQAWLETWLDEIEDDVANGDVAASTCLQGAITEHIIHGHIVTDWLGIMQEYLTRDGMPLAYSELYGKRLYAFAFWLQSEVHAIHARWWIERASGVQSNLDYRALIEGLIQPSGWIYNPLVSPTGMRTRMKSEYLMSLSMGIEILNTAGGLAVRQTQLEALLSAEPLTGYLSAEYFRAYALSVLGNPDLTPADLSSVALSCEVGRGYSDFDVNSKISDYMGTAHRIGRDIPVHSALSALHASYLAPFCSRDAEDQITHRIREFGDHIKSEPMDIQPFRMREIDIPFGTGLSPLELIAASGIVQGV